MIRNIRTGRIVKEYMSSKKYISTKDVVRLTGLSTQEIYDLIHSGTLPAHKAPKSGWRVSPQDLEALGLIKEKSDSIVEKPQMKDRVSFVADEEHYTAYIGSANITSAAIGERANSKRNHEAGMLVQGENMIQAPLRHFEKVWNAPDILKHTWKRFATKARELDKELKERYGK